MVIETRIVRVIQQFVMWSTAFLYPVQHVVAIQTNSYDTKPHQTMNEKDKDHLHCRTAVT